jgi:hypothetical protein
MQISIFGIAIAAVYSWIVVGLLLLLWYPLRRWRYTWVPFAAVGLAAMVAPWAEEYWIASRFEELCKDAGVHVYRKVDVEGFYDSTMHTGSELIEERGYRFMEHPAKDPGRIEHVERIRGEWKVTILDHPTARYHFKYAYQPTPHRIEEPVRWKLERTERRIVDSQTNEIIGREVIFKRRPSVMEGLWIGLVGSGLTICPNPGSDRAIVGTGV